MSETRFTKNAFNTYQSITNVLINDELSIYNCVINAQQCVLITHPCPVAEGEHQRNQPGFQFGQGCQVIGGKTSDIVACTDFAQQATAQKQERQKIKRVFEGCAWSEC